MVCPWVPLGRDSGLGRRARWAVHGIGAWVVHGMGARCWLGGRGRGLFTWTCDVIIGGLLHEMDIYCENKTTIKPTSVV